VSDRIAEDTGVRHESPQLLILQDGDAVFDASHHRVKADRVREQLVSS
jgi:bacillithiol system protein YtxJ